MGRSTGPDVAGQATSSRAIAAQLNREYGTRIGHSTVGRDQKGTDRTGHHVFGLDGKFHPAEWRPAADQWNLIGPVHAWHHREGLSIRQIVARLGEHGVRRSIGTVHRWLHVGRCTECPKVDP